MVDIMSPNMAEIHKLVSVSKPGQKLLPTRREPILTMLQEFILANEDPRARAYTRPLFSST
jgi:hypothetical protein